MSATTENAREEELHPQAISGLAFAAGSFFSARSVFALLFVRVFGMEPRTAAELTLALNLLLLGLVCFDAFGVSSRTFGSILRVSSIRWVLVFLIFSGCSLAWSGTVSLPTSAAYWCGLVADVAIVFLLLRTGDVEAVSPALMRGFIWSTCCLALVAWIMPAQSDLRLGDEDFFNTNQIGNLCAFGIFFAQYLARRKDGRWGWATFFLVATLLRSLSKTTIIAFLISQGYLLIQDRSISRKTKLLLTTALVVVVLASWGFLEAYYDIYTTAGNASETLTGRTLIWSYVSNAALLQPWIGHGFDSMWKVVPPFGPDRFEARHAENEVLQQFYAYGVVGVVMLVGIYGTFYRKLRSLALGPLKLVFVSLLFFVVVRGLAEAEPFDLLLPLWLVVAIAMLVECEGGQRIQPPPATSSS